MAARLQPFDAACTAMPYETMLRQLSRRRVSPGVTMRIWESHRAAQSAVWNMLLAAGAGASQIAMLRQYAWMSWNCARPAGDA